MYSLWRRFEPAHVDRDVLVWRQIGECHLENAIGYARVL